MKNRVNRKSVTIKNSKSHLEKHSLEGAYLRSSEEGKGVLGNGRTSDTLNNVQCFYCVMLPIMLSFNNTEWCDDDERDGLIFPLLIDKIGSFSGISVVFCVYFNAISLASYKRDELIFMIVHIKQPPLPHFERFVSCLWHKSTTLKIQHHISSHI